MNGRIAVFILASVLVIAGAYYSTYFLATKTGKMRSGRSGRMIKLIDRFSLSKDKSIYLIGIKDKVYFVVITGQSATLLEKFDIAELETASVSGKSDSAPSRYEPQGMLQKSLWNAYSSIKGNKDKHEGYKQSQRKQAEQSRQASGEVDNLELVYKRIQSRLSSTNMSDQENNEENYL
ncbi:MAG: FliO/MopB family protein [Clostridiales bacterium]|jgi:flagellar biogenesis protein FliO|nr:FliO/MopB family protein [Clostridiales bacterium]